MKFVIHRHDADRAGLHHDLRLEIDGVYKSWVIPKLLSKTKRRLAIQVNDHDLSWGDFEGTITEGYGKGKITIFDKGNYDVINGKFTIKFKGKLVKGLWRLKLMENNKWLIWKVK